MCKRGQSLAANQIIGLVLAILGFVIVIFLLASLDFQNYSADEACRLSVVSRATGEQTGLNQVSGLIPLQCTTEKICITNDGSECPQFFGEENVEEIRLSGSDVEKSNQISALLSESFYNCWYLMGEGKLDLFSGDPNSGKSLSGVFFGEVQDVFVTKDSVKPKCIICSRVALAEDLIEDRDGAILQGVDVQAYMANNRPAGSDFTYLQLLSGNPTISSVLSPNALIEQEKKEIQDPSQRQSVKVTDELAIIFSQIITDEGPTESAISSATNTGILTGGLFLSNPLGRRALTGRAGGWVGVIASWGTILVTSGVAGITTYSSVEQGQVVSAVHCGEFISSEEEARQGCSLVKFYDYNDIAGINGFCRGGIDGNP